MKKTIGFLGFIIIAGLISFNTTLLKDNTDKTTICLADIKAHACDSMEGMGLIGSQIFFMQDCGWMELVGISMVWKRGCMDAQVGRCDNYDF